MLELIRLVQATLVAAVRRHRRIVVENLLLRQQFQVALRFRRRPRLLARGKLSGSSSGAYSETGDASCSWSGCRLCWVGTAGAGASFGAGAPAALGRPRLNAEVQVLIAAMGRQNPRTE